MNRTSVELTLNNIREFLNRDAQWLMRTDQRSEFVRSAEALLEKARSAGEVLYVGILGGTGVGKSTLINALARKEVSKPSDRRPYTDRAVVYRHQDRERGLDRFQRLLRSPDAIHDSDVIKDLAILDLPDFDSQDQANRRTVLELLPALDAIIWVVSPEKYADAAFYRFVKQTAINQENFTFVLNKGDELIASDKGDRRYDSLKEIRGDLAFRLEHETGVERPRIFSLSALAEYEAKAVDPLMRTEFGRFREFLMVKRDAKEIASAKMANIIEESGRLLAEINEAVRPEEKDQFLRNVREAAPASPDQADEGKSAASGERASLARAVFGLLVEADNSIGPVNVGVKALSLLRGRGPKDPHASLERMLDDTAEKMIKGTRMDVESASDRADSELMFALGPAGASLRSGAQSDWIDRLKHQTAATLSQAIERRNESATGFRGRARRLFQKAILLAPVLALIGRLAGQGSVERWVDNPGVGGALGMLAKIAMSLFGPEGLIGLTALAICELLLIGYMSSRRIRALERDAGKLADAASEAVTQGLGAMLLRIETRKKEAMERVSQGVRNLMDLNAEAFSRPAWKNLQIPRPETGALSVDGIGEGGDAPMNSRARVELS